MHHPDAASQHCAPLWSNVPHRLPAPHHVVPRKRKQLTLVLEGGEGSGLLGLLGGGKGSGRAEDSSEAGDSLHLSKKPIRTILRKERRRQNQRRAGSKQKRR